MTEQNDDLTIHNLLVNTIGLTDDIVIAPTRLGVTPYIEIPGAPVLRHVLETYLENARTQLASTFPNRTVVTPMRDEDIQAQFALSQAIEAAAREDRFS